MSPRVLALIILIILIWIPAWGYWYFTQRSVAGIDISVENADNYRIEMQGTLKAKYLPLADKLLKFSEDCARVCRIGPIAPVTYQIILTSSGRVTITDTIELQSGETKMLKYQFFLDPEITLVSENRVDPATLETKIQSLNELGMRLTLVWVSIDGRIYVTRDSDTMRELGILTGDKFLSLKILSPKIQSIKLDASGDFFIIDQRTILARNLDDELTLPDTIDPISIVRIDSGYKVTTPIGVWVSEGDIWTENPRYSDYLDISPTERIGYIRSTDTARLSLANLPSGVSVLSLLDRSTGKSTPLKQWIDIIALFMSSWVPAYRSSDRDIYTIKLPR